MSGYYGDVIPIHEYAGKQYQPSNGTEGECFFESWCSKCKRDTTSSTGPYAPLLRLPARGRSMADAKTLAAEAKKRAIFLPSTKGHDYDELLAAINALAALAEGLEREFADAAQFRQEMADLLALKAAQVAPLVDVEKVMALADAMAEELRGFNNGRGSRPAWIAAREALRAALAASTDGLAKGEAA